MILSFSKLKSWKITKGFGNCGDGGRVLCLVGICVFSLYEVDRHG
jgi:hypothetical protein